MHFPMTIHLFGFKIPPHPVFETLAYVIGFTMHITIRCRRNEFSEPHSQIRVLAILLGCLTGALVGARLLADIQWLPLLWRHGTTIDWFENKTIVGGLIGGWIGVEVAKKLLGMGVGIRSSIGDTMVFPPIVAMAVGRIGCFLTGLSDGTCGSRTTLPWGVNFGDGVYRHPTQIYDMVFLTLLGLTFLAFRQKFTTPGYLFRTFIFAYMCYRFLVDFLKPQPWTMLGMTPIQIGCLGVAGFVAVTCAPALLARWSAKIPRAAMTEPVNG